MEEIIYHQNICSLIRLIRQYKGLKQEYVANKSRFGDRSVYAKLESGKLKNLSVTKFYAICKTLNCDAQKLMLLASVDDFRFKINSWAEFIDSLEKCDQKDKEHMLDLVNKLFPANT